MNRKYLIMLGVCLALLLSDAVYARHYVIALSPMQGREALQNQSAATLRFLMQRLQPGESALVVDGLHLKTVAHFTVKDKAVYNNPKAKMQLNKKAIAALRQFSERPVNMAEHGVAGMMQVPQLLQFLGNNYGPFRETTDIIILGSPLYVDIRNPDWGMTKNRYYADGHFNAPPQSSPFSLQGRDGLLNNTRIHWAYLDDSWISRNSYRERVTRMWTLLMEGYGSQLATFTGDFSTVWRRAATGAEAPPHGYKLNSTAKLETIQLFEQAEDTRRVSIYDRQLTDVPPTKQVLRQAQNVEIGISWNCEHCDLDLYVRPHRGAEVLYFGHRQTPLGYYHKDFTHSPQTDGGYETVTFTATVDLQDVLIAVNWYDGESSEGVQGEIRLAISDQTYGLPFVLTGTSGSGTKGKDKTLADGKPANANWLIINPKDIVGL